MSLQWSAIRSMSPTSFRQLAISRQSVATGVCVSTSSRHCFSIFTSLLSKLSSSLIICCAKAASFCSRLAITLSRVSSRFTPITRTLLSSCFSSSLYLLRVILLFLSQQIAAIHERLPLGGAGAHRATESGLHLLAFRQYTLLCPLGEPFRVAFTRLSLHQPNLPVIYSSVLGLDGLANSCFVSLNSIRSPKRKKAVLSEIRAACCILCVTITML